MRIGYYAYISHRSEHIHKDHLHLFVMAVGGRGTTSLPFGLVFVQMRSRETFISFWHLFFRNQRRFLRLGSAFVLQLLADERLV